MGIVLKVVDGPSISLQVTRISLRPGAGTGTPGSDITTADFIQFNTALAAVPDYSKGLVFWHPDQKTMCYFGEFEGPIQNIGEELWATGINKSGAEIADGKVTYVDGAVGNRPQYNLALADSLATSLVIGVATMDIADNAEGIADTFGLLRDINTTGSAVTETWSNGEVLWVHPTIAGEMTNVKPVAPYLQIPIALVLNAHATQGLLFVRAHFPINLAAGTADGQIQFVNGAVLDAHTGLSYNKAAGILTTELALDVTNFDNNLSASDDTVQKAMETLDELAAGGGSEWTDIRVETVSAAALSSVDFIDDITDTYNTYQLEIVAGILNGTGGWAFEIGYGVGPTWLAGVSHVEITSNLGAGYVGESSASELRISKASQSNAWMLNTKIELSCLRDANCNPDWESEGGQTLHSLANASKYLADGFGATADIANQMDHIRVLPQAAIATTIKSGIFTLRGKNV